MYLPLTVLGDRYIVTTDPKSHRRNPMDAARPKKTFLLGFIGCILEPTWSPNWSFIWPHPLIKSRPPLSSHLQIGSQASPTEPMLSQPRCFCQVCLHSFCLNLKHVAAMFAFLLLIPVFWISWWFMLIVLLTMIALACDYLCGDGKIWYCQ